MGLSGGLMCRSGIAVSRSRRTCAIPTCLLLLEKTSFNASCPQDPDCHATDEIRQNIIRRCVKVGRVNTCDGLLRSNRQCARTWRHCLVSDLFLNPAKPHRTEDLWGFIA